MSSNDEATRALSWLCTTPLLVGIWQYLVYIEQLSVTSSSLLLTFFVLTAIAILVYIGGEVVRDMRYFDAPNSGHLTLGKRVGALIKGMGLGIGTLAVIVMTYLAMSPLP